MPYIKASEWKATQDKIAELEKRATDGNVVHDPFAGLRQAIDDDSEDVSSADIGNALLNQVCVTMDCRETAFIMEKGESVRTQPFRLTDGTYKVVTRETIERLVKETKVNEIEWTAEEYDCDDIARKFVTRCVDLGLNSVGRVMSWSGKHAFNIAVIREGDGIEFVFIEPQTDEFVVAGVGNYSLENALIIIS